MTIVLVLFVIALLCNAGAMAILLVDPLLLHPASGVLGRALLMLALVAVIAATLTVLVVATMGAPQ